MRPRCVILAGPNGAGKSTHARQIVQQLHGIERFINPDTIASGLAGFSRASADRDAGRIALNAITDAITNRIDFAFETTLAGRRWPRLLDRLDRAGFEVLLHYLWMPRADLCVERVRTRVSMGGHDVPEVDVRRRYVSSLQNLMDIFMLRDTAWHVLDASVAGQLAPIATGGAGRPLNVIEPQLWHQLVPRTGSRERRS